MLTINRTQDLSSTDYSPTFIQYQFQLTRSGEYIFSDSFWMRNSFPEESKELDFPPMQIAMIDGELRLVNSGAPPGLQIASEDASILHVRE